jgi:hypothetical protein
MRGRQSLLWRKDYGNEVRAADWDIERRKGLPPRWPRATTQLNEGQGIQPRPFSSRSPSRLKPEREQNRVVVILRERKQGQVTAAREDLRLVPVVAVIPPGL